MATLESDQVLIDKLAEKMRELSFWANKRWESTTYKGQLILEPTPEQQAACDTVLLQIKQQILQLVKASIVEEDPGTIKGQGQVIIGVVEEK